MWKYEPELKLTMFGPTFRPRTVVSLSIVNCISFRAFLTGVISSDRWKMIVEKLFC